MGKFTKKLQLALFGSASLLASGLPLTAMASAIISNGTIQLGINDTAELNVGGGTRSSGTGTTVVGLRYVPTNADSTSPGCTCEGWGAGDRVTGISGYANTATDGVRNLSLVSFTSTASTAVSVVNVLNAGSPIMQVTHDYHPSAATPNLYEATVTIKNTSSASVSPSYRRVMDWDIEPTAFREYSTIQGGNSKNLKFDSDNGFETANPFGPRTLLNVTGNFTDNGPADHGALFDFEFDPIAPGASVTFSIYYGAAADEAGANGAIGAVSAEVYSYGQPSKSDPALGTPNTFVFAFSGVGGSAARCGAPDDASGLLKLNNCFTKAGKPTGITVLSSTYSSKAVPEGPAGTYTNVVKYCNQSAQNLIGLYARVAALTNGNSLISRTTSAPSGAAGGAGAQQTFVKAGDYTDGTLAGGTPTAAGECVNQTNVIGLSNRNKFTFSVDIIGDSPLPPPPPPAATKPSTATNPANLSVTKR